MDKQLSTTSSNNNDPKIVVNDVTAMTSPIGNDGDGDDEEHDDQVKELSRQSSIPKRQTALTLEVGGIR